MRIDKENTKTLAEVLYTQSSAVVDSLDKSLKSVYSIRIGVFFNQDKRKVFDTLKSAFNAAILEAILLDYLVRQSREEKPDRQKIKERLLAVKLFFLGLAEKQPLIGIFHNVLYDRTLQLLSEDCENVEEFPIYKTLGILITDVVNKFDILEPKEVDEGMLERDMKIFHLCQIPAIFRVQNELGW